MIANAGMGRLTKIILLPLAAIVFCLGEIQVWAHPPQEIDIFHAHSFNGAFLAKVSPELFDWSDRKHWGPSHSQELWKTFESLSLGIPPGYTTILWASHDHFDQKTNFTGKRLILLRNGKVFIVIDKNARHFPKLDLASDDPREKFEEDKAGSALFTFEGKPLPQELFVREFSELIAESANSSHLLAMVVSNELFDSVIIPHLDSPHFQEDHWIDPQVAGIVATVLSENLITQFRIPLPKPFRMSRTQKVLHFVTPRLTADEISYLLKNAAIIGTCMGILKLLDFPHFGRP